MNVNRQCVHRTKALHIQQRLGFFSILGVYYYIHIHPFLAWLPAGRGEEKLNTRVRAVQPDYHARQLVSLYKYFPCVFFSNCKMVLLSHLSPANNSLSV